MLRSGPLRPSYATARVVSLDNGREVTPEMGPRGVERSATQWLRAGTALDVKGKTLDRVRAYFQQQELESNRVRKTVWIGTAYGTVA